MFFRREKPVVISFDDRISGLKAAGYAADASTAGQVLVSRQGLGAMVSADSDGNPKIDEAGILIGKELGLLTDLGYQKIFRTSSGKVTAATAEYLRALHNFLEDLREELRITSLYNESLGSTNELHVYDRVEGRDQAHRRRPWE
jgi:hypothetical protein